MRAQTTLDFATGISIFLLALLFVFTFVPGTLQPFTRTSQEETVGANRVADLLVTDVLADPANPYVLDGSCTADLLSNDAGAGCGFDGATLEGRLDLSERTNLNVTVRGEVGGATGVLCWDDDGAVVGVGDAACDVPLRAGDTPPQSSGSTVTAVRTVTIRGTTAVVEVGMW